MTIGEGMAYAAFWFGLFGCIALYTYLDFKD